MKTILSPNPQFTPSTRQLNFAAVGGFTLNRLLAVIDQTTNTIIYAASAAGLGYSAWNSSTQVMTLQFNTTVSPFASTDSLICIYDDPAASVTIKASASSGVLELHRQITSPTALAYQVKASSGTVYGVNFSPVRIDTGFGVYPQYLHFYDTASSPTVGTDVPTLTLTLIDDSGSSTPYTMPAPGILFSNGIFYSVTGGSADNDTTAPQAGSVINIQYM
jgi:hypothetical protein